MAHQRSYKELQILKWKKRAEKGSMSSVTNKKEASFV